MSGHVRNMYPTQSISQAITTLISLLLVTAIHSSSAEAECRNKLCAISLRKSLKLTNLIHKESANLLKIYKTSQGDMIDGLCQMSSDNVPDPNISGLDPSERMLSIYSHCNAFLPHLARVAEQQTDLQLPSSPLPSELLLARTRIRDLASQINCIYQNLFPNLPTPHQSTDSPTSIPPSQNVFQQKVYGCVVLKRLKEFLSQVKIELKKTKKQVCRPRSFVGANVQF
ncbi:hypothetical protein UPYG_G00283980 [Umbra pygmaea]|uniref:Ciliary neurotrophic factor n=1 Tax=Umbra pygmaea TaxID=75934 RepID=A0ABD0WJE7_UMBPY